jgi:hypothetical protein
VRKTLAILGCAALAFILLGAGCSRRRAFVAPVPAALNEIEGYASLKLAQNGVTSKSKFSFILEPSRRARVEIQDLLGRTVAVIFIEDRDGYFVVVSDKAYWKAAADEIVVKFLGVPLNLPEIAGFLCGRWSGKGEGDSALAGWVLNRDGDGRWASGRRDDLAFKVREFFPNSPVPRRVDFQTLSCQGSLNLLSMGFNKPLAESVFALDFLKSFTSKSWAEIEKALRDEN